MRNLNDIPEPVQWYEGMLLAPQHFQQAWLRSEALTGYTLMQAGMFPWGVKRLSIDRSMLASGTVRILALEAILPDGLAVLHPRGDEPYLELDITGFKRQMAQDPMAVHIAVPVASQRPEPGDTQRWRSVEGEKIADANTHDNPLSMPRLRPELSLIVTEGPDVPPPNRYVSMPVACISFHDDAFILSNYAPPRPDFPADCELSALCRNVVQKLREKALTIADRMQGSGEFSSGTMASTLRSMVTRLPQLEALMQVQGAHPFQVYLALCNLIGSLSWLSGQPVPPTPPVYHHTDALPAFTTISDYVLHVLERVRVGYLTLRFRRTGDGHFTYDFKKEKLPETLVIGARVPPTTAPADVAEWLSQALIGSQSKMNSIAERRIRGAERVRIESADEMQLKPQAGLVLFRITVRPDFIVPTEPLNIIGTGHGLEPMDLQLFEAQQITKPAPSDAA